MSYYNDVDDALQQVTTGHKSLIDIALGRAQEKKADDEDAVLNKVLMAEGFRPIVTPEKEVKWVPKKPQPTDVIKPYQKASTSMSPELLQQTYPFLQYAEQHFIPVVEQLVQGVQNQDFSMQYLQEKILEFMHGGLDEAIKATGGMKEQGKGSVADSSSAAQTAVTLHSEKQAYKALSKVSKYAKNGYTNVAGGE